MILELDCGNSSIKWRTLDRNGVVRARGAATSCVELIAAVDAGDGSALSICRMVSVRSEAETEGIRGAVAQAWSIPVRLVQPAQSLAGARNGYADFRRLGLDRWMAIVGAYDHVKGSCLIFDLGTAATADYVTAAGQHLGGFICPGAAMMCGDLRTHTRRIQFTGDQADRDFRRPGTNTGDAVRRGAVLMLRAFVEDQLKLGATWLGASFDVFVTGGDAMLVEDLLPNAHFMPDLVFLGLAQACPLSEAY